MFDEKSEISETLEWMLQSRQVGDEVLVNTLVQEQYTALRQFGLSLFDSSDSSRADILAEQVICAGVEDAHEYKQEKGVQVWLLHKAVEIYHQSRVMDQFLSNKKLDEMGEHPSPAKSLDIWKFIDTMSEDARLAFILMNLLNVTEAEIGSIMDLSSSEVEGRLGLVKEKLPSLMADDPASQIPETDIQSLLCERWPTKVLSTQDEKRIAQRILNNLMEKEHRKQRLVILGELTLVVMAILIVAGLGRMITYLTPTPTPQLVYQTELVSQIVFISPTPDPTLPPTPFPELAILYRGEGGETLADIADLAFLNVIILEAINNIPPDQPLDPGQIVMIGVSDSQLLMPKPYGGLPVQSTPIPTKEPLTMLSSEGEILQRIMESRDYWFTLWADALIVQYGPPGYVGKPDIKRQQIWIDQPYFSYVLDGANGGQVEYIYTSLGGLVSYLNLQTGKQLTNIVPDHIHYLPDLQQMLLPNEFREEFSWEIEILRQETTADREVLVFDWYTGADTLQGGGGDRSTVRIHEGRYWVDTTLGLILRLQKFNGQDLTQLFEETIVTKIEFNVDIPNRLFDRSQPSQTYFAQDHHGDPDLQSAPIPAHVWSLQPRREMISYQLPPPEFDPGGSHLTFQWTSLASFNPQLGTQVDLFGDEYYLGNIEFAEPNQLLCARSSDGNLIAFSSWSDEFQFGYASLRWLNLIKITTVHHPLPEIIPYDFAFSPDNQQLAVYGCRREGERECGIYLVDTVSSETRYLTAVERGSGLIWNPDSNALAIQGSLLRQGKWRVLVFSTETGNVIYDGPFDWEGFWVAPNSPIHDWGVPYPPIRGGLKVCSQPPP